MTIDPSLLTLEEQVALLCGHDFMCTNPIPRLSIPSLRMADGPHGLRVQTGQADNGVSTSLPATAFPTAAAVACSFDPSLTRMMAEAIGREANHYGVQLVLGPGLNIKRNPLCGRNFEYFSEDPLVSSSFGTAFVEGLKHGNVGAVLKHFAMNNQENFRFVGNSIVDERAKREIYLRSFESVVKQGKPAAVMCAYNQIDGIPASQNEELLKHLLRDEWGFHGLTMTDWGGTKDRIPMLRATLDLEMPGDVDYTRFCLWEEARRDPSVKPLLDESVSRVLQTMEEYPIQSSPQIDWDNHHELAIKIATECAVLLKNDQARLPLRIDQRQIVIGDLFVQPRYQGSGSSLITPARFTTPRQAFMKRNVPLTFARGYDAMTDDVRPELEQEALKLVNAGDRVLLFAGLTDFKESEGGDREDMKLPQNQLHLIDGLLQKGALICMVLFGGAPVELPFFDQVESMLMMYLPGQGVGEATARLLYGETSPSGRLAETWPLTYDDVPFGQEYSQSADELYKESIFVGYRYYGSKGVSVRFPFGYGLGYTTFQVKNVQMEEDLHGWTVSLDVENTGFTDGSHVIFLFVKNNDSQLSFKAVRELKCFQKVFVQAKSTQRVFLRVKRTDLSFWHVGERRFVLENGEYALDIAESAESILWSYPISIADEPQHKKATASDVIEAYSGSLRNLDESVFSRLHGHVRKTAPPKLPLSLDHRFIDFKRTFFGNILFQAVTGVAKKQFKAAKKMAPGPKRDNALKGAMFLQRIFETNSLRTLSMSAGKNLPFHIAEGMTFLAKGKLVPAIQKFRSPYRAPQLPKDTKGGETHVGTD